MLGSVLVPNIVNHFNGWMRREGVFKGPPMLVQVFTVHALFVFTIPVQCSHFYSACLHSRTLELATSSRTLSLTVGMCYSHAGSCCERA